MPCELLFVWDMDRNTTRSSCWLDVGSFRSDSLQIPGSKCLEDILRASKPQGFALKTFSIKTWDLKLTFGKFRKFSPSLWCFSHRRFLRRFVTRTTIMPTNPSLRTKFCSLLQSRSSSTRRPLCPPYLYVILITYKI